MKKLILVLCVALHATVARAEFWSGNNLYERLISSETIERVQAMGYVMGVYDVYVKVTFCPGSETQITVGQIRDMAIAWLAANPTQRNRTAESLINEAFKQAWPCRNRGVGGTRL